jgi:hypothetical protein
MWNVKEKEIAVIKGATGNISESFRTSEKHTGKAQNQGTTNSHVGYRTAYNSTC